MTRATWILRAPVDRPWVVDDVRHWNFSHTRRNSENIINVWRTCVSAIFQYSLPISYQGSLSLRTLSGQLLHYSKGMLSPNSRSPKYIVLLAMKAQLKKLLLSGHALVLHSQVTTNTTLKNSQSPFEKQLAKYIVQYKELKKQLLSWRTSSVQMSVGLAIT